jgi:uncharacterized protein YeaO (DUF488 family)
VYDSATDEDGFRVLVDRIWPRGISRQEARVDEWLKELGPSNELRKWFGHDPSRWDEFRPKYRAELDAAEQRKRLQALREAGASRTVTLLFGAKDREHNQAVVIAEKIAEP